MRFAVLANRSMPACDVIPVLGYPDVRQAVDWLVAAFGFQERLRIADHRSQLTFGSGAVVVTRSQSTPTGHSTMVRVDDVDAHYARAKHAGAEANEPETYPYGERQYSVIDPGGHAWTFSQSVTDVDPASWGGVLNESAT
jgi:uncharacterized glyoxalase superfamily protein PhnB